MARPNATTDDVFEWIESRYDVRGALEREVIDRPPKRDKTTPTFGVTLKAAAQAPISARFRADSRL